MVVASSALYINTLYAGIVPKMVKHKPPRAALLIMHTFGMLMELVALSATGLQVVAPGEHSTSKVGRSNLLFVFLSGAYSVAAFMFSLHALRHSWRMPPRARVAAANGAAAEQAPAGSADRDGAALG